MKTNKKSQIVKIIEEKGKTRPAELCSVLGLSPQMIHRHLKQLVLDGKLSVHGSPPFTQYSIAGVPEFESLFQWVTAKDASGIPSEFLSETRDAFVGRLPRMKDHLREGLAPSQLPLAISVAGEIGNNTFDHNLGQWRDVPGCWFECQLTGGQLWMALADRGQGIFRSLARVHPGITDEEEALKAAFEKVISGRAPEQRGNGLKFVRSVLSLNVGRGLACVSGGAFVSYGELGLRCLELLKKRISRVEGTVSLLVWSLQ